jgi:hypothetical protein
MEINLDFSYLLYFKRKHLWEVLQSVVAISHPYHPPTIIRFPDHEYGITLDSWDKDDKVVQHDDPTFSFLTALIFEEDEVIHKYLLDMGEEFAYRRPPGTDRESLVTIEGIILTVYNNQAWWVDIRNTSGFVLLDFHTTGLRMDLLFYHSPSIRATFTHLLERHHGLCGIFAKEINGELYWLAGQHISEHIDKPYLAPVEIEELMNKRQENR